MDDLAVAINGAISLLCLAWALRALARGSQRPTRFLRSRVAFGPSLVAVALFAVGFAMTAVGSSGRPAWGLASVFVIGAGAIVFNLAKARGVQTQR